MYNLVIIIPNLFNYAFYIKSNNYTLQSESFFGLMRT